MIAHHTIPPQTNKANYRKQRKSAAGTEFMEFPGRNHLLLVQDGWDKNCRKHREMAREGGRQVKLPKEWFWPGIGMMMGLSIGWAMSLSTGQWAYMVTGIFMGIVLGIVLAPKRTKPEKEDQPPAP